MFDSVMDWVILFDYTVPQSFYGVALDTAIHNSIYCDSVLAAFFYTNAAFLVL